MMRTVRLLAAVAPAAALLLAPATVAAPYVPKDDATVLERLPLKPTDPLGRELRELRPARGAAGRSRRGRDHRPALLPAGDVRRRPALQRVRGKSAAAVGAQQGTAAQRPRVACTAAEVSA